jgi:hypothetical protein
MRFPIALQCAVVSEAIRMGARWRVVGLGLWDATRIGTLIPNHLFMIPGLFAAGVAVLTGMGIAKPVF